MPTFEDIRKSEEALAESRRDLQELKEIQARTSRLSAEYKIEAKQLDEALSLYERGEITDSKTYRKDLISIDAKVKKLANLLDQAHKEFIEKTANIDNKTAQKEMESARRRTSIINGEEVSKAVKPVAQRTGVKGMAKQFEAYMSKENAPVKKDPVKRKPKLL